MNKPQEGVKNLNDVEKVDALNDNKVPETENLKIDIGVIENENKNENQENQEN